MFTNIIYFLPINIKNAIKKIVYLLSDRQYIYLSYFLTFGRFVRLDNPIYYTEKIQWLKLYQTDQIYSQLADKYTVRAYIEEKIGAHVLIPQYRHGENPEDIPFDSLPDAFVIKCNHGSGFNIIVKNKKDIDPVAIKNQLTTWLAIDFRKVARELQYKKIKKQIIIEQLLIDKKTMSLPHDYKIYCFGGTPKYIFLNSQREQGQKVNIFDTDRHEQSFECTYDRSTKKIEKPSSLSEMLQYATVISTGFPFMRVDFYEVNNKVYFGEVTLTPNAGYGRFRPNQIKIDKIFGDMIILPKKTI